MKKRLFASACAAALLLAALALPAAAEFDAGENYMARMTEAVLAGDFPAGRAAAAARAEKIAALALDYPAVDFDELWMLSKIIWCEAGSVWLPMEWKMAVGEVVLNRMASPEFPDTMQAVLEQPGQYYGEGSAYFNGVRPSAECVEAARRVLEGERVLGDPSVVFQSNFRLGSGVFLEMRDAYLGSTYFCISSRPELYAV